MSREFWKDHWEKRSKQENEISVSGWGSRQIKEYLYDIDDICKKLKLNKNDKLLNIGCGNGLMELVINNLVFQIDSVDFSKGMVKRATGNNKNNKNVKFYFGNILDLSFLNKTYDKIFCNSVIQYLDNLEELGKSIAEIKSVCKKRAVVLISANPDISKLDEFLKGYDKLKLTKKEKENKKQAARLALWTNPKEVAGLSKSKGFKTKILKMNPNIWQSWYMYDLLLWR